MAGAVIATIVASSLETTFIAGTAIALEGVATATTVVAVGKGLAAGVGAIAGGLANSAISGKPSAQSGLQARSNEIKALETANYTPIPVIYGAVRTGGIVVFRAARGYLNHQLYLIAALGEGPIEEISQYYGDNRALGHFVAANGDPRTAVDARMGEDSQTHFVQILSEVGVPYTTAHTFSGIAVAKIVLSYDITNQTWPLDHFPALAFDVKGRKLYDSRTSTTAWSDNPALAIRDYLTNTRYGRGIPAASLDATSFESAADYCDALVAVPGGTQKRYRLNGEVNVDNTPLDNLREMLTTCRGSLVWSGGKYKLVLDRVTASTFAFTTDNIVGAWQINLGGKRTQFNRVRARFINPDLTWQLDVAVVDSPTFRAADNGLVLEAELDLPYCTNIYQAQHIAGQELKQSRLGINVEFRATLAALEVEVGDVVTITHATPGWSAKKFRVTRLELLPEGEVAVSAREYDDTVYTLDDLETWTPPPSTDLVTRILDAPSGLSAASGTEHLLVGGDGTISTRVLVSWAQPDGDVPFVRGIELQWRLAGATAWDGYAVGDLSQSRLYLIGLADGLTYDLRARWISYGSAIVSPWAVISHTVLGKTAPPANVTGFAISGAVLSWSHNTEPDLAGYRLRWQPGQLVSWADAQPLHSGLVTESPFTVSIYGPATFMIKAVDTTGNESAEAAVVITDLADPLQANVVETVYTPWYVDNADGSRSYYPGTKTGCAVGAYGGGDADDLLANSTSLMWSATGDLNSPAMWGADSGALMWAATSYADMSYVAILELPPVLQTASMVLVYSTPNAGVNDMPIQVSYRVDGSTPMWGVDDAAMWVSSDGGSAMWTLDPWLPWPGRIVASAPRYELRWSILGGGVQGVLIGGYAELDVPDVQEALADVPVLAAGTRLPLTRSYSAIKAVSLTVQADGGTAISARIEDKLPTGPLIKCLDAAGTAVDGTVDAIVQGY